MTLRIVAELQPVACANLSDTVCEPIASPVNRWSSMIAESTASRRESRVGRPGLFDLRFAKMPQSNLHLKKVFCDAFRQLDRGGKQFQPDVAGIEVKFYPYAGLHHTIRVRAGRIFVRLSDLFQTAPPEVIRALAFLLVARLLSRKAPRDQERIYRSYAFSPQLLRASDIARRQRGRKVISSANGEIYDLERIFAKLNRRYFDGEIAQDRKSTRLKSQS